MAHPSPFELTIRQRLSQLGGFWAAHRRALGPLRGSSAMAGTLARFIGLRRRISPGRAPMVDDAVAFAVAAHRSLSARLGPDEALQVVQDQIVASGTEMMADWVPTDRSMTGLGRQVRLVMGDAAERDIYEIDGMSTSDTGIRWDVTACRYAALSRELGSPEVAQVFCAVDGPFVAEALPELPFNCDTTIARGDDRCRFRVGDQAET